MAGLPALKSESSTPVPSEEQLTVAMYLSMGWPVARIAKTIAPNNKARQKYWRSKIRRWAYDPTFEFAAARAARAEKVLGLGGASHALVRKARAGRVDAIKLLFESTGYFSPRTEHEHTGDIQITIKTIDRPKPVEDVTITDAQVVD